MAKKVLKTRVQFTSTMRKDLYAELQKLSQESMVPISRLIDRAMTTFLFMNTLTKGDQDEH